MFWRHLLIEESRDGIVVLDQFGKVYEVNQKFAEMLGYSVAEVSEFHVWDWEVQHSPEIVLEMIRSVDENGQHFTTTHRRKDGSFLNVEISSNGAHYMDSKLVFCVCRDITLKIREAAEREELINKLQSAIAEIKTLRGILPLCSFCNKIRDDEGYWEQVDVYINKHSEADISHSICPQCAKIHYPDLFDKMYPDKG